jgi:hypothetical protein
MEKLKNKMIFFFFDNSKNFLWISFFRISIGTFVLFHFITILSDFDALYSNISIIPSDVSDIFIPEFIITLPKIISFFECFGISVNKVIITFKLLYVIFCLFLIIGFKPRISAFFLLFLQIALTKSNIYYAYGVDFFTSMSLFYLILIPSNFNYTFKPIKEANISAYKRLFQIHISIVYFFSGFDKIIGFNWWNGESIWKAINLPFANSNFEFSSLANFPILLISLGWFTILIEMLYPIFIWIKNTRKAWILLTITLHIGIAFVLNLYFFSVIMITWNLTLLYSFEKNEY